MYEWVVFAHVASILAFMLGHGTHVVAMVAIAREPDPERMLTFFNIVPRTRLLRVLLAAVLLTGAIAGFMGNWWGTGWIWASLALLLAISVAMWRYGGAYYGLVQEAALTCVAADAAARPGLQAAYDSARRSRIVEAMSLIGLGGTAVILWLMMFKPF